MNGPILFASDLARLVHRTQRTARRMLGEPPFSRFVFDLRGRIAILAGDLDRALRELRRMGRAPLVAGQGRQGRTVKQVDR